MRSQRKDEQLYCPCGEKVLRGKWCVECKSQRMDRHDASIRQRVREAKRERREVRP
jgi:hypothetical protein